MMNVEAKSGGQGVVGSNPAAPTKKAKRFQSTECWARDVLRRGNVQKTSEKAQTATKSPDIVPTGLCVPLSGDPLQAERQRIFLDYYSWSLWAQGKVRNGLVVSGEEASRMRQSLIREAARDIVVKMAGYGDA